MKKLNNYFDLARLAINNGDYQEAINIYNLILSKDKKNLEGWIGLSKAFYKAGNLSASLWASYRALELSPDNGEIKEHIRVLEESLAILRKDSLGHMSKFIIKGSYIYQESKGKLQKFIVKGINIGLGLPGFFPGEYPIQKTTYLKFFQLIEDLGLNTIRIYTLHPPAFYEALYEFNKEKIRLYLIQGIWYDPPHNFNLEDPHFKLSLKKHVHNIIDAIHGNITLPERPGFPAGEYLRDISGCLLAYLFGREPEPCLVKNYNSFSKNPFKNYSGKYLFVEEGSPFEIWNAMILDEIITYSKDKYNQIPLVSVVNWPPLDPIEHYSETTIAQEAYFLFGEKVETKECIDNDDEVIFNPSQIKSYVNNLFISYHVYPYYPDFMNYSFLEESRPYYKYLEKLKACHFDIPLLIAEFGIPTSRISAHWQLQGWSHGGIDQVQQGYILKEMIEDITKAGCAGYLIFSLFDEWYKSTWFLGDFYKPRDRKPLWFNLQDPEENYGLIEIYPGYPKKIISLSGNLEEWNQAEILYFKEKITQKDFLRSLKACHDEGFLYLRIETFEKINFEKINLIIGIDTGNEEYGEFSFLFDIPLESPIGLKYLIHLAGKERSKIYVHGAYNKFLKSHFISPEKEIYPSKTNEGNWNPIIIKTNRRRVSKDFKKIYSPKFYYASNLKFGSLDKKNKYFNSLADFYFKDTSIELRLPWELLNFSDPSTQRILWLTTGTESIISNGLKVIILAYKPHEKYSPTCKEVIDFLPNPLVKEKIKTYIIEPWDYPIYHMEPKLSFYILKDFLRGQLDAP